VRQHFGVAGGFAGLEAMGEMKLEARRVELDARNVQVMLRRDVVRMGAHACVFQGASGMACCTRLILGTRAHGECTDARRMRVVPTLTQPNV
jgi:hypothetical protein